VFLQTNVVRCMLFACYLLMRSTDARIDLNVLIYMSFWGSRKGNRFECIDLHVFLGQQKDGVACTAPQGQNITSHSTSRKRSFSAHKSAAHSGFTSDRAARP